MTSDVFLGERNAGQDGEDSSPEDTDSSPYDLPTHYPEPYVIQDKSQLTKVSNLSLQKESSHSPPPKLSSYSRRKLPTVPQKQKGKQSRRYRSHSSPPYSQRRGDHLLYNDPPYNDNPSYNDNSSFALDDPVIHPYDCPFTEMESDVSKLGVAQNGDVIKSNDGVISSTRDRIAYNTSVKRPLTARSELTAGRNHRTHRHKVIQNPRSKSSGRIAEGGSGRFKEVQKTSGRFKDQRKVKTVGRRSSAPVYTQEGTPGTFFQGGTQRSMRGGGTILMKKPGRKDNCFSFFDIETDKVSSYQYRPGEEVTGVIHLIVRNTVEVWFVELEVTGQGQVTVQKLKDGMPRTVRENYLYKQTYVIGSADVTWTSLLTPGHYSSKFRVKLPPGLPSTVHHDDVTQGLSMDIGYQLTARVCDDLAPVAHHGLVKVLMEKKVAFNVQRSFDLATLPDAGRPVSHVEHVHLSCNDPDPALVSVCLDRAVCLAGDDVKLQLLTGLPRGHKVKSLDVSLQEHVTLDPKHDPVTFTLTRMTRQDPQEKTPKTSGLLEHRVFDVTLPTQTDLVSSYSLGVSKLRVNYSVIVELKFNPAGGKLSFKIPLEIGPCADPIYGDKTSSRKAVPLFNRPTRFPGFSTQSHSPADISSRFTSLQSANANVTTKYTNGFVARCFLCCIASSQLD